VLVFLIRCSWVGLWRQVTRPEIRFSAQPSVCVNVSLRSSSTHGGVGCTKQDMSVRQVTGDRSHVSDRRAFRLIGRLPLTK